MWSDDEIADLEQRPDWGDSRISGPVYNEHPVFHLLRQLQADKRAEREDLHDAAADEVARQVPTAPRWKEGDDWREYGARCLSILGPTVDLVGPHRVTTDDAGKAFAKFVEGIRR
jgi:hypothetical protein